MAILPQEIIRKKRDGAILQESEIRDFVQGMVAGVVSEAQMAAFAMTVYFRGMEVAERVAWTEAMRDSGEVMQWGGRSGAVIDKHSTGGVGDNVSLILGPLVAACGGFVPMISGRGLGHTGGTLDKLDSIPGYQSLPSDALFRRVVKQCGVAIIGQTASLAPADGLLYATRDVTATVESVDLITASILSKKLAAGLQGLVMDVKFGNGAFMADMEDARALARSIVDVAKGAGVETRAVLTDMNEPLARSAGNALEVLEAVRALRGQLAGSRLMKVVLTLGAQMLEIGGLAASQGEALERLEEALQSCRAAEVFDRMVCGLGGPKNFVASAQKHLPQAPVIHELCAEKAGYVQEIATRELGLAVVALGGGRSRADEVIDHAVGLSEIVEIGDAVAVGDVLCRVHALSEEAGEIVLARLRSCFAIGDQLPQCREVIGEILR